MLHKLMYILTLTVKFHFGQLFCENCMKRKREGYSRAPVVSSCLEGRKVKRNMKFGIVIKISTGCVPFSILIKRLASDMFFYEMYDCL